MENSKMRINKISKMAIISLIAILLTGLALVLAPTNAHAGFLFVNNQQDNNALQSNETNDGNEYVTEPEGDGMIKVDSSGYSHEDTMCFLNMPEWFSPIKISRNTCTKLEKGGIKGTDTKDDFVGKLNNRAKSKYRMMDISLEVHDNKLKMNYKTDTPWFDFDGAKWTLDFGNGFVHRWQDRMDGSDSESHTFNKDELKKYFNIDAETTTLQQAIENGQCSVQLDSLYIDDWWG